MKSNFAINILLSFLFVAVAGTAAHADTTCVRFGAIWKFLDRGIAAPAGTTDWRSISFTMPVGKAGRQNWAMGAHKERTTVSYGPSPDSKYITTYFRRVLNITDISLFSTIRLNAYIDDGAVIYVNGAEVARFNITGKPTYATLAAYAEENGNTISTFDIPATNFISGKNVIAVEVHQSAVNSSDLAFDMEVIGKTASVDGIIKPIIEPDINKRANAADGKRKCHYCKMDNRNGQHIKSKIWRQ